MEGIDKEKIVENPNRDDPHEQREDRQKREGVLDEPPPAGDPPLPPAREDKAPGKPTPGAPSIPYTKR